jgi:hypothetical protein
MLKKHALPKIIISLILLFNYHLAFAAIPPTLNYQGHLTNNAGAPINGPLNMTFKIYDVNTGGIALWSETRSVMISQGVFSIELGESASPLPLGLFENTLWIGLSVDADAEMTPRRPVTSTGFSFKAGDADTLEGISAATLDQSAHVTDTTNPHSVTAAQVGAADAGTLTTHTGDTGNPHSVTAAQTGAATSASFTSHTGDVSAHHTKTINYSELSGTVPDVNIASTISRDSELASHSTSQSVHHAKYSDGEAVAAIKAADGAGSTLDADMVDGLQASEIIDAAQDEVRTPISSLPYTITQSGSYYLTGNLTTTTSSGITINVDDVTLDLMGFTINGTGASGTGIYFLSQSNVTVKNGTVKGFGSAGIYQSNISDGQNTVIGVNVVGNGALGSNSFYSGIYMNGNFNHIERCMVTNNGGYGIYTRSSSKIISNTVTGNGGTYAIYGGTGSYIKDNTIENNTGSGIYTIANSRIDHNSVAFNTGSHGIYGGDDSIINNNMVQGNGGIGIETAFESSIIGNTSNGNGSTGIKTNDYCTIEGNTINSNGDIGLFADDVSIIRNNSAGNNQRWGIYANGANHISNNLLSNNNRSISAGEGGLRISHDNRVTGNTLDNNDENNILVVSGDNLLKDNHITDGSFGIKFTASGNYYLDNSAAGNGSTFYSVGFTQTDGGGNVIF